MNFRFGHIRGRMARGLVVAATLLITQMLAQAHGLQFGLDEHDHNGIQCDAAILQEDLDDVDPGVASSNLDRVPEISPRSFPQKSEVSKSCVLLPSTRGPPASVLTA